jgi:aminopeptidase N
LTEYDETVIMPTYLVAIVVSDYQCRSGTGMSLAVTSVCSRPAVFDQLDLALEVSIKILDFLEEYTKVPFALPKIGYLRF